LGSAISNVQELSICCYSPAGIGVISHSKCNEYSLLCDCVSLLGGAGRKTALFETQGSNVVKHRAGDPLLSSPTWVKQ